MSKTKQKIAACIALLSLVLPAGNGALAENTNSNLENGLEAIQDAMNRMNTGKYAVKGDKILDTHVGSASSLIACHNLGFDYVGFELDKDYYSKATERLEQAKSQSSIFDFIERI